jgi:cytochrome c oxidase subunit 3
VAAEGANLAHHFEDLEQQHEAAALGMWVFLATEVLVFGALFTSYSVYRCWYPHDFEAASQRLNVLIGAINTVVLLTSSLTMALSVYAAQTGRQRMLLICLVLTAALGTLFMILKGVEYYDDYRQNLVPKLAFRDQDWTHPEPPGIRADPEHVKLFLLFYYIMTGLHAVHLTVGIGVMIWVILLARRRTFSASYYSTVEVSGLYWHFVDIVWIFLLPILYLTGTHALNQLHF